MNVCWHVRVIGEIVATLSDYSTPITTLDITKREAILATVYKFMENKGRK